MSKIVDICDSVMELFGAVQIDAVRTFLSQARRRSEYKYLSLEIFGSTLVVSVADVSSDNVVINPFYDGTNEKE